MSRRHFLRYSGALLGGCALAQLPLLQGCTGVDQTTPAYSYWQQQRKGEMTDLEYLVMCGALAANPHNTQPWRFQLLPDRIEIYADRDRHLGAADPHRRMQLMAVGCALENMMVAAEQLGYRALTRVDAGQRFAADGHCATLDLSRPAFPRRHPWFDALFRRQTTRSPYAPEEVAENFDLTLDKLCEFPGIALRWYRRPGERLAVADLVRRSARAFVADEEAYRAGMKWFRLTRDEWERHGDGIAIFTGDAPWYVKQYVEWFASREDLLGELFKDGELAHVDQVATATPLWGLIFAERPDVDARVLAGRMAERVYLEAAARGYAVHPLSYPTETPSMAEHSRNVLGLKRDAEPLFLFRVGKAPYLERSVRRDISAVII